jgi:hypothetical protein
MLFWFGDRPIKNSGVNLLNLQERQQRNQALILKGSARFPGLDQDAIGITQKGSLLFFSATFRLY